MTKFRKDLGSGIRNIAGPWNLNQHSVDWSQRFWIMPFNDCSWIILILNLRLKFAAAYLTSFADKLSQDTKILDPADYSHLHALNFLLPVILLNNISLHFISLLNHFPYFPFPESLSKRWDSVPDIFGTICHRYCSFGFLSGNLIF